MKFKLSNANICVFLMTMLVFLDMTPYFVWAQVSGLGYKIYTSTILITTVFMLFVVFNKKLVFGKAPDLDSKFKIYAPFFAVSFGIVLLFFYKVLFSGVVGGTIQEFNFGMLCIHIGLMAFCLQDNVSLRRVFLNVKTIFAITLIPSVIIFFLLMIGIELPYQIISADMGKVAEGQSYRLYFGVSTMLQGFTDQAHRLCGIYNEPGFVGTVGALFLIGDKITLKKWQNVVILVASLCTFSLAFIIMFLVGLVLHVLLSKQNKKKSIMRIGVVIAILLGYFTFLGLPLDSNTELGKMQQRLDFTEEGIEGDNRMNEYSDAAYDEFLKSDFKTVMLGYGKDSRKVPGTNYSIWQKAHSYKEFIFNFGVIGLVILLAFFAFALFFKYRNINSIAKRDITVFALVFLISIYQRYGVDTFHYFCLFFGGASNLALMNVDDANQKTNKSQQSVVLN